MVQRSTRIETEIETMMKSDDDGNKDRDKDEGVAEVPAGLGHEKLKGYGRGPEHVTGMYSVVAEVERSAVVLDHPILVPIFTESPKVVEAIHPYTH